MGLQKAKKHGYGSLLPIDQDYEDLTNKFNKFYNVNFTSCQMLQSSFALH